MFHPRGGTRMTSTHVRQRAEVGGYFPTDAISSCAYSVVLSARAWKLFISEKGYVALAFLCLIHRHACFLRALYGESQVINDQNSANYKPCWLGFMRRDACELGSRRSAWLNARWMTWTSTLLMRRMIWLVKGKAAACTTSATPVAK